ncbi:MAG: methyltransferase [Terriglobia bacterium]|jgi:(2Fe-2S) ferredoxin/ubiquinone/menaquinone biosynthesis C-methylase UbiE/DNA-binding CsgD family transcriptional regulator
MEPFHYHVYICDQKKPEGVPCCPARGSAATIEALRKEVAAHGLMDEVQITTCGSLGVCERGPNLVVYPEGVWYSGVRPEDVPELVESHFVQGRVVERLVNRDEAGLRAEIQSNRAKFMAAQRAKEAAGVLPDDLNQTLRAYMESRALLTALELDVFTAVGSGATAAEVAQKISTHPRATEMLLNALAAMGMIVKQQGVFRNTPATARYFAESSKDNARPGLIHIANIWHRWSNLTECVRAGTAVGHQEMAERGEDWTEPFIAAMHRNAAERAPLIVKAVGTEAVERLLDVGGGSAAYSIAFAQAHEKLHATVLDLPTVLPIAQGHISAAGLAGRVETRPCDLRRDPLGKGFTMVLVSAICHMLSPAENQDLFRRCFAALEPQGRLVMQDFILEPDKTAPKQAALFALNMLVGTPAGSTYSDEEYTAWLREAGFQEVRQIRLPGPSSLMVGVKQ